jgi:hypothetical protein
MPNPEKAARAALELAVMAEVLAQQPQEVQLAIACVARAIEQLSRRDYGIGEAALMLVVTRMELRDATRPDHGRCPICGERHD